MSPDFPDKPLPVFSENLPEACLPSLVPMDMEPDCTLPPEKIQTLPLFRLPDCPELIFTKPDPVRPMPLITRISPLSKAELSPEKISTFPVFARLNPETS
eukprot:snap_masked-scaffold_29-processed-gene-4.34-mRNA-1 protein AED:1.00 eAED:1.00 QI:0/-1/0/0/-1/1/1/0/99